MPEIQIGNEIIDFPSSGQSPNWASAIIQFAQAVEGFLATLGGTFDVFPQAFTIDAYNTGTNVDIPALSFSTASVRAVFIRYTVYRTTSSNNADEAGDIIAVYNENNATNFKWTLSIGNKTGPGANITFNVTDTGQFQFTTTALPGSSHAGQITFEARALEQS